MRLAEIPFADLVVQAEPSQCRLKRPGESLELGLVPEAAWEDLRSLYAKLGAAQASRFRLEFNGMLLRAQSRETAAGHVFVVRRIDRAVLSFKDLKMPPAIVDRLRTPRLHSGMVLFCGPPGAGKTTAACAMVLDRLQSIGGFTWTAENPVEYDLQGTHGRGQCYQVEIDSDAKIADVFSDTVRSGADTFFLGEIREQAAAGVAGLASASGMLVVSTLHADTPQQAIMKMAMLSSWQVVAQSLRAVVVLRQQRRDNRNTGLSERTLLVQPFFVEDEAVRTKIRDGNLTSLNADVDAQERRFLHMGAAA